MSRWSKRRLVAHGNLQFPRYMQDMSKYIISKVKWQPNAYYLLKGVVLLNWLCIHDLFAPDAVNKNGTIITVDLADSYDYTQAGSLGEWYTVHANRKFDSIKSVTLKQ